MTLRKLVVGAAGLFAGYAAYRACSPKIPVNVAPVEDFDAERYLGTWYEVGRVDNRFERGLIKTKAEYTLNEDGSINVLNSGFNPARGRYTHASGTALFVQGRGTGALKVSFFGPFFGGYNIVALDEDYQWSIVIGSSPNYFWVLSRDRVLSSELRERAISVAMQHGIVPASINWVDQ